MTCTASSDPIYLDGFASTPLAPEARDAMLRLWDHPGNASSPHIGGARAAEAIAAARSAVAELIGATAAEIVFTSGATEADNLAITGVARQARRGSSARRRIVVSAIEHKAVLEPAAALAHEGFEILQAPVGADGVVDLAALARRIDDQTLLVSVMAANNETGVLQPIADIAALAHSAGALFHCDAAQAAGKIAVDVLDLDIDYLSLSAHKLYGPQGVGALYVSSAAPRPAPLLRGGGHEQGLRSGTEPAALLAGFGAAATVARARLAKDAEHSRALAERFRQALAAHQLRFSSVSTAAALPGAVSIQLEEGDAAEIVERLAAAVCLSTGSACNSGQVMPSHVLGAMGIAGDGARRVLRAYCGRYNTSLEIDRAAALIAEAARKLRLRPGDVSQ